MQRLRRLGDGVCDRLLDALLARGLTSWRARRSEGRRRL